MEQEIEASQEGSTHPSIEGSQPEQRSLGSGDVFLPINDGTVPQLPNSAGANETTVGGFTRLHKAAAGGNKDEVLEILAVGKLKVDVATSDGHTPLHFAAYGGHETIVTSLRHWYGKTPGADVNARDNVLGRTALHYAVGGGHQRVVEELLKFPRIDKCPENSVQNLTPLLMEVMKSRDKCSLDLVKTLIFDLPSDQINCAVGPALTLTDNLPSCSIELFPSEKVLQNISSVLPNEESGTSIFWYLFRFFNRNKYRLVRKYQKIEEKRRRIDGSLSNGSLSNLIHFLSDKCNIMGTGDSERLDEELMIRENVDRYEKYKCSMAGHTIFHLAATQDNAEVLSHLLSNCPSADVTILTADGSGMTPLHCAIRAESSETFDVLMSHGEVDVNAVLKSKVDLARPPWTELRLHSWWTRKKSKQFRFYEATCVSDTPLHLAIRCCSFTLRRMVTEFCNHPRFQPSIYNESGVLSLDLAWLRSSCRLQFGDSSIHLHLVLDMLERHPRNQALMNEVNSMKTGAQNFVNAVLVAAVLLEGVTFSAIMQGPLDEVDSSVKWEYYFYMTNNMISFYFSMLAIVSCLVTSTTLQQHRHLHITDFFIDITYTSARVFYNRIRFLPVTALLLCMNFGIIAFVMASWINFYVRYRDIQISTSFNFSINDFTKLLIIFFSSIFGCIYYNSFLIVKEDFRSIIEITSSIIVSVYILIFLK